MRITKILNTSFKGDVLRLASGNAVAIIIALIFTPILTRLYQPEAFGLAALFTSIITILGVLACMRYELSIVLPDNDEEAANLLGASLCFSICMALLTIPLIYLTGNLIVQWVNMPKLKHYLWLIPIAILFHGIFHALNYWNTRRKHFTRLSYAQITNHLTSNSTMLTAGLIGHTTGGMMIIAEIIGRIISTLILGWQIWRENSHFFIQSIRWKKILAGIQRYKKFPIYGSWSILLGTSAWQLPILLLGAFFSPSIVGYYSLGFRILQAPMALIGNAIGKVFYQKAVEAKAEGKLAHLVENLFQRLVMASLIPMLMLTLIGRDLYIVVFGNNWAEAGVYTQILSVWAFFWFLSGPFTNIFSVIEKQEKQLMWNISNFIFRLCSILIGVYFQSARLAISLLAITGIIIYGQKIVITLNLAEVSIVKALKILGRYTLFFIPVGAIIIFLNLFQANRIIILLVAGFFLIIHALWVLNTNFPEIKLKRQDNIN